MLEDRECEDIAGLLRHGFTFRECLDLTEDPSNREVYNALRSALSRGEDIADLFPEYCHERFRRCLSAFLQYLSFQEALQLTLDILHSRDDLRTSTLKELLYPAALLAGTFIGIILFNELCFPPLISLLEDFSLSVEKYRTARFILRSLTAITVLLAIGVSVICIRYTRPAHIVQGYRLLQRYLPHSLPVIFVSVDFVRYYRKCADLGFSTKNALGILRTIPDQPVIQWLSSCIEKSLEDGDRFTEALDTPGLDRRLLRFIRIAVFTSELPEMLGAYIRYSEESIRRRILRISRIVQIVSYLMIGTVVILVYQILLLPLTLMMQI